VVEVVDLNRLEIQLVQRAGPTPSRGESSLSKIAVLDGS
jgi:hypothetical protein